MGEEIIYSATAWRNNSELIADVARLGYIEGTVLDVTYGLGNFWNERVAQVRALALLP